MCFHFQSSNDNFLGSSKSTIEREDSGHGSSSSPSSPVKSFSVDATSNLSQTTDPQNGYRNEKPSTTGTKHEMSSPSEELFSTKYSPMAFTVDFGGTETKNAFGIADSISKFAPTRHRRNLSQSKSERRIGSEGDSMRGQGHAHSLTDDRNSSIEVDFEKGDSKPKSTTKIPTPSKRASPILAPIEPLKGPSNEKLSANHVEEDKRSETGTYTVGLDGAEATKEELTDESPVDSSLEWVREWAETASKHIKIPPVRGAQFLSTQNG